jgi:hypothetical protein
METLLDKSRTAKDMLAMPYYRQWEIDQYTSNLRKKELARLTVNAYKVIDSPWTDSKTVSDFPVVEKYLLDHFHIDLSDVPIYVADLGEIERAGWKNIGGCYIRHLGIILVKSDDKTTLPPPKGLFEDLLRKRCSVAATTEDIVVHELCHAISHRIGRSASKYSHMEEEFVYTNCIDFYKQQGMTEWDIINDNFLPFCMHDVYSSRRDMITIFGAVNVSLAQIQKMSESEYRTFLDKNAETLIPIIKRKAQEKAKHMISLYQEYGKNMSQTTAVNKDDASLRFASLDLD